MRKNAKVNGEKRQSQMRNNAFRGEKNAKVKCEITRIKAKKKRERQMRNNANISIIPNIIIIVNCLNNLYDMIL